MKGLAMTSLLVVGSKLFSFSGLRSEKNLSHLMIRWLDVDLPLLQSSEILLCPGQIWRLRVNFRCESVIKVGGALFLSCCVATVAAMPAGIKASFVLGVHTNSFEAANAAVFALARIQHVRQHQGDLCFLVFTLIMLKLH